MSETAQILLAMYRTIWVLVFIIVASIRATAQIPTSCLEIQSLLVDACVPGSGCTSNLSPNCSCEGKNEMVRFITGPNPISISDLSITWPNNTFLGISSPNAGTATLVADLQATVSSPCGLLLEPPGGIIPAGKKVLLITSTDMCTSANSFASLVDTFYVIFQNSGNFQGHFANHNNSGTQTPTPTGAPSPRTLSIGLISTGCSDVVTYDRAQLININGLYGGASALNDGARVDFDFAGNPTYLNNGCIAPFEPTSIEVAAAANSVCANDTLPVSAMVIGSNAGVQWSGGAGVFINGNSINAFYVPATSESGSIQLICSVVGSCGVLVSDTVAISVLPLPQTSISASGSLSFCQGNSVQLFANGANSYVWTGGSTATQISVNQSAWYVLSGSNSCGTTLDSVEVIVFSNPIINFIAVSPLCENDSPVNLVASPLGGIFSGTGVTASQFDPSISGSGNFTINYSFTDNNNCSSVASISISVDQLPVVSIANPGSLCLNQSAVQLSASPSGGVWSGNGITNVNQGTFNPSIAGIGQTQIIYSVDSGACSNSDTLMISVGNSSVVNIDVFGQQLICSGESLSVNAIGNGTIVWSDGTIGNAIVISNPGTYYAVINGACGTDTSEILIVNFDNVTAQFNASSTSGTVPFSIQFQNQSNGAVSYQWISTSGNTSVQTDFTDNYSDAGSYEVMLIATSAAGCKDTAVGMINAYDSVYLFIPNVFSPNGDLVNDEFEILSYALKTLEVIIYNRWGQEITRYDGLNKNWKGESSNGNEVPEGTYFYLLRYIDVADRSMEKNGTVTLIKTK